MEPLAPGRLGTARAMRIRMGEKILDKGGEQIRALLKQGLCEDDIAEALGLDVRVVRIASGSADASPDVAAEMNGILLNIARDSAAPFAIRAKCAIDQRDEVLGRNEAKSKMQRGNLVGLIMLDQGLRNLARAKPDALQILDGGIKDADIIPPEVSNG